MIIILIGRNIQGSITNESAQYFSQSMSRDRVLFFFKKEEGKVDEEKERHWHPPSRADPASNCERANI